MKKIIIPELNNKLFSRKIKFNNQIVFNKNFLVSSSKSFTMMKNIIEIELFAGQRPKVIANLLKKTLIVNLKVTINSDEIKLLPWLQHSPVIWKRYLSQFNLFKYYSLPPYLSSKSTINIKYNNMSAINNWLKSAYLD